MIFRRTKGVSFCKFNEALLYS